MCTLQFERQGSQPIYLQTKKQSQVSGLCQTIKLYTRAAMTRTLMNTNASVNLLLPLCERKTYSSNAPGAKFLQTHHHLSTHRPSQFPLIHQRLFTSVFIILESITILLLLQTPELFRLLSHSTYREWTQPPTFSIPVPKQLSKPGEKSLHWIGCYHFTFKIKPQPNP